MDFAYIIFAAALVIAAAIVAFALLRRPAPVEAPAPDKRLDALLAAQGEIKGQFSQTVAQQAELQRTLTEQIDALKTRLGDSLTDSATKATETFTSIQERLKTIDEAQKNIASLGTQVVSLQEILSDKQSRGAFGQERMEAIVADQLPPTHYDFQFTLSNGKRPDCVIRIPNVAGVIVVDSKFPLEAFETLRGLASDDERKQAAARLKSDVQKHVKDIAEKYLIPGEVQTPAIMFVPSESVYAELHTSFSDVVQQARRAQVVIVSPHVFMLAINTIQTLMRDAKMREQAHKIQAAVGDLLLDVRRLGERVGNLRTHFDRTNKDIGDIETSMKRIETRAARIENAELSAPEAAQKQLP
ncbi:MAG TPA: DNA recombination protein RmuC [Rhizomicrobium sp.]|nr:DNA recombination protein RmuC [Rhizomicrobium sp.]